MPECYIRGSTIKYLRIPDEVIENYKDDSSSRSHNQLRKGDSSGRGGGRGGSSQRGGRGGAGGRGGFNQGNRNNNRNQGGNLSSGNVGGGSTNSLAGGARPAKQQRR